jgi:hypothetical protein
MSFWCERTYWMFSWRAAVAITARASPHDALAVIVISAKHRMVHRQNKPAACNAREREIK